MEADLEVGVSGGEREAAICGARGMAEMQVNVLRGGVSFFLFDEEGEFVLMVQGRGLGFCVVYCCGYDGEVLKLGVMGKGCAAGNSEGR